MPSQSTAPSVPPQEPEAQSVSEQQPGAPRVIATPESEASAYEERAPEGASLAERLAAPFDVHFTDVRGGVTVTFVTGEQVASRLNHVLGLGGWKWTISQEGYDADADEFWVLGHMEAWIDGVWVVREQYGSAKLKRSKPLCAFIYTEDARQGEICNQREQAHADNKLKHRYYPGLRGAPLDIGFDKKGASTDALKKCATLYGVGLYLLAKKGGVANQQAQVPRQPSTERRAAAPTGAPRPASTPRQADKPTAPAKIVCKQAVCVHQVEPDGRRCGDVYLVHKPNFPHAFEAGSCDVALERTDVDGQAMESFQFANHSMSRFKQVYCRRHYDAHAAVEERR